MTALTLQSPLFMRILLWSAVTLVVAVLVLVGATLVLQLRADRLNARRIAACQRWEAALPEFLFGAGEIPAAFRGVAEADRSFLRQFLNLTMATVGGNEGQSLKQLYFAAGLDADLDPRLRSGSPRDRAVAALEVGSFDLAARLPDLVPLLQDPAPFVAFAAARSLAESRDLAYAGPVLEWVVTQDQYQQERLISLLEGFGPGLLSWLEALLRDRPSLAVEWRLFALLAASHKHHESLPVLLGLLKSPDVEVQAAAIRGLTALGDPVAYPQVAPFAESREPLLRMNAAQALGTLGGNLALPALQALLSDLVYDVRRHASHSLANLGVAGISMLEAVAGNPAADPFARDMAAERLEWAEQRGRA